MGMATALVALVLAAPARAQEGTQIGGPSGVGGFPIFTTIAGDAGKGRVLAVYTQLDSKDGRMFGRVFARPLRTDGTPLGPAVQVSPDAGPGAGDVGAAGAAGAVYDSRRKRFLIVWPVQRTFEAPCGPTMGTLPPGMAPTHCTAAKNEGWAALADVSGRVRQAPWPILRIGTEGAPDGSVMAASVAYNARSDRYFAVYTPLVPNGSPRPATDGLVLQAFDAAGSPLGAPREMVAPRKGPIFGTILANPRTGENLVVYSAGSVIRDKPLDARARPLPGPGDVLVSGPGSRTSFPPWATADPETGDYLVTWMEGSNGRTSKLIRRALKPTGRLKGPRVTVAGRGAMTAAPDPGGPGWIVSWSDYSSGAVQSVRTEPDAQPLSDPVTFATGTPGLVGAPSLMAVPRSRQVLAVWSSQAPAGTTAVVKAGPLRLPEGKR
jgi:hypothetical protein